MTKPPLTTPTVARFLRGLIPDKLWERLGNRPALDATIYGDCAALVSSVGSGAPCRLLVVSADWDGVLRCRLWELGRKGVKDLAEECVNSRDLVLLLERWHRDYLN